MTIYFIKVLEVIFQYMTRLLLQGQIDAARGEIHNVKVNITVYLIDDIQDLQKMQKEIKIFTKIYEIN